MLALLSPAKSLDFSSAPPDVSQSQPACLKQTRTLASHLRALKKAELKKLLHVSDKLADLNYERFQAFKTPFTPQNAKQAALAFSGDVYQGLDAASLSAEELGWAQDHVRILSGFYGLLRPLDLIQPYRLEMGRALKTCAGDNLYAFWGDKLTRLAASAASKSGEPTLINLASAEYFAALQPEKLKGSVITPGFREIRDGKPRFLSFFAKKARGMMARYIIQNRISRPEDLKSFDLEGYRYDKSLSDGDQWIFTRKGK